MTKSALIHPQNNVCMHGAYIVIGFCGTQKEKKKKSVQNSFMHLMKFRQNLDTCNQFTVQCLEKICFLHISTFVLAA